MHLFIGQMMTLGPYKFPHKSGPCRDRTDDPQIKSVSEEDDSKPD